MSLSKTQQVAFNAYKKGENVFITGAGGTGKSHLIRRIAHDAIMCGKKFAVTAMTGRAAKLIGYRARTIHSWGHISPRHINRKDVLHSIINSKYNSKDWKKVELLIVDEVSMMSQWFFDTLNCVAQLVRKDNRPFGGIQVIFCGDFFQLPPVCKPVELRKSKTKGEYCFNSKYWYETFDKHIILKTSYRQKDDTFISLLNNARTGELTAENIEMLKSRVGLEYDSERLRPIRLYPKNYKVQKYNLSILNTIETEEHEFPMKIGVPKLGKTYKDETIYMHARKIIDSSMIEETLVLKKGCQVMCTFNIDQSNGIVNGSIGYVVEIMENSLKIEFDNGNEVVMKRKTYESDTLKGLTVEQYPLVLAWAISIHKAQGASLSYAEIDLGDDVFEFGQSYVALSRLRSLEGLYISKLNVKLIKPDSRVLEYYEELEVIQEDGSYSYFENDDEEECVVDEKQSTAGQACQQQTKITQFFGI